MTNNRKNQFEELIDAMMIDEVAGLDQDIRKTLENLPIDKKRMAILSILDKDRDMFMKIKKMVDGNCVTKAEHIKSLSELMRAYVRVGEVEKKTFGEVMTPQSLVNDMMDTLPADVWSNPSLKWLDPCSGVGIFSGVIVERLMEGLKEAIPSDEQRYKHIVENMIHVGELQPKNMFLFLAAFDPKDEYEMNVYTGSFLDGAFDEHAKNVWGVEKFDVIVQNPPYQTNNPGEKKTHPIWDKFVKKALELTVDGGYMVAVHPSGWRNVDGRFKDTQLLLRSKQIEYLEMHSQGDGVKTFGAKTDYDFYCIKNCSSDDIFLTKIKNQKGVFEYFNLKNLDFIPNGMFKEVLSLVAKPGEEKVEILYSRSNYGTDKDNMSREQTEEFKYPCTYTVMKKGPKFYYSNTKEKGHFGISKFIWGNGEIDYIGSIVDKNGEFGLTQFTYGLVENPENLDEIKKVFDGVEFKKILNMCCIGKFSVNEKIFATFRKDFWKEFLD